MNNEQEEERSIPMNSEDEDEKDMEQTSQFMKETHDVLFPYLSKETKGALNNQKTNMLKSETEYTTLNNNINDVFMKSIYYINNVNYNIRIF